MTLNERKIVKPYKSSKDGKKKQVEKMFDNIAYRYDFLNHTLSLGIDRLWRKKVIKHLKKYKPINIIDIATGTGDFAIELKKSGVDNIIGADISEGMLNVARSKAERNNVEIHFEYGDSENLKYQNDYFCAVTAAFGVRNFENLDKGLSEMYRILKKGGVLAVLELSEPRYFPIKQIFRLYFKNMLPLIGRLVSKDQSAYNYLPDSVENFPYGKPFLEMMKKIGFENTKLNRFTFGIATVYYGEKQ